MFFNRACHASKYLRIPHLRIYLLFFSSCLSTTTAKESPSTIREHIREKLNSNLDDFRDDGPRHRTPLSWHAPSNSLSKTSVPKRAPFGSVIVKDGIMLAEAANQGPPPTTHRPRRSRRHPSAPKTRGFRTQGGHLYTRANPAPCASARIYWRASTRVFRQSSCRCCPTLDSTIPPSTLKSRNRHQHREIP